MSASNGAIPPTPTGLTPEIVRKLREPFPAELIKWKIQTNPREGEEWAVVVAYGDARDVCERLDAATGGNWSAAFAPPPVTAGDWPALECALTVCGVTRRDVGTVERPREGDDATKDLYSDALKRAAVQFGVFAFLYRFPAVKAKAQKFGRSFYLTFQAQDELLQLSRCLIDGMPIPHFTDVKVSGSAFGADGNLDLFEPRDDRPPPAPAPAGASFEPSAAPPPATPQPATPRTATPATNGKDVRERVAAAQAALTRAEGRARPSAETASPASPPANNIVATGAQLGQIARSISAIKAAYGPDGVSGLDEIGESHGLPELAHAGRAELANARLGKPTADQLIRALTGLEQRLDAAAADQSGYAMPL